MRRAVISLTAVLALALAGTAMAQTPDTPTNSNSRMTANVPASTTAPSEPAEAVRWPSTASPLAVMIAVSLAAFVASASLSRPTRRG